MGRIDRSNGQDAVMERRHIQVMLRHINEYEQVKSKSHLEFKTATEFYKAKGVCKQNFLKYYRRYCIANRDINSLIPHKTGRKFKDVIKYNLEVLDKIKVIRAKGYNRYDISILLKKEMNVIIPPTTVYRLLKKLKINRLNTIIKEEKRRIIKMNAGELGHIDVHYITKGTVKDMSNNKRLYIIGIIDSYSRICWLEVINNIKSSKVSFVTLHMLLNIYHRYGIRFKEIMSDNGSEFGSGKNAKNKDKHPFELMLDLYNIKHIYTKPFSPKTNGKIERFWKTIENELLSGEQFETIEEFKHYIKGYMIYYNEHRIHQGIKNKIPYEMLKEVT